jgi:D-alanyl-D-alanine carboxypeptidase
MLKRMLIGLMVFALSFPAMAGGKETTAQAIDDLLKSKELKHSLVGIYAVSINSGEEIYARNADISMIPASNNKLFTTAAALGTLGPNYTYTTTVERVGDVEDGILKGHLAIVGSGDPTISGRFHDGDMTKILRDWVDAVKPRGFSGSKDSWWGTTISGTTTTTRRPGTGVTWASGMERPPRRFPSTTIVSICIGPREKAGVRRRPTRPIPIRGT